MRCLNCEKFSLKFLCKECKNILSQISLNRRKFGDFDVFYFYFYSEIKNLILSKHHEHGYFIYNELANLSFKKFASNFDFKGKLNAVPLDDNVRSGYSHTAILARALKSKNIKPLYNCLRAQNFVSYAGKSLLFRLKNPRNFKIYNKPKFPVILIDDIVTTGTSLLEAKKVLENSGFEVLFGLVLANVDE